MRVIGEKGQQLGILSIDDALKMAQKSNLDLVEISPNANPPVVKIINWGKFQYQKMKQSQKNRKNSKTSELKQMRFSLKISDNDLNIKFKKIQKFLDKGHKVRISIFFKGREMAHKQLGYQMMEKILNKFDDNTKIDQKPQFSGRNLSVIIRSK